MLCANRGQAMRVTGILLLIIAATTHAEVYKSVNADGEVVYSDRPTQGAERVKMPPLPTILFGALLGGVCAVILQPEKVLQMADAPELATGLAMAKGVWLALASGYVSTTGVVAVDELLTRGGMESMLVTIWFSSS